jgi:hypothetical protein
MSDSTDDVDWYDDDYVISDAHYASESEFQYKYGNFVKFVKFVEETMIEVEE